MPIAANDAYTGTAGQPVYAGRAAPQPIALTTLTLQPTAARTNVPLTFGQPFKAGDWNPQTQDLRVFSGATELVSQTDAAALHVDGSTRFAVVSAVVPAVASGVPQALTLKAVPKTAAPAIAPLVLPADWQLSAVALIHRPQVTQVSFTDRTTGGFVLGEVITVKLSGLGADETYSITIKGPDVNGENNQVGVDHIVGINIANEFHAKMAASTSYWAHRLNGDGYEKLWIQARNRAAGTFTVTVTYAGTAKISQMPLFSYGGPPQEWRADFHAPVAALVAQLNAGGTPAGVHLRGPAATELTVALPFKLVGPDTPHAHLMARAAIRFCDGGAHIRADIAFENNWTFKAGARQITYSLEIRNGATVKHSEPVFAHFHGARWHKATWFGANPEVHFKHDVPYFLDSRAVLNYDRSLVIDEAAIVDQQTRQQTARTAQAAEFGPMSYLLWRPGMGDTGGRDDLGASPRWFVMHLLAQDPRTKALMLAQSDAAGAWGTHFRDEGTDRVVTVTDYPNISVNANYSSNPAIPPKGLDPGNLDPTGNGSDLEHQADMAYIPYLVTGDHYYLEELQFWGGFCPASRPADYREFGRGIMDRNTLRATAWSMRNISNTARILPENHPLKAYFNGLVDRNWEHFANVWRDPALGSPLGAIEHPGDGSTAPWQMDFLATTLALSADNGHANAQLLMDWTARFTAGRMNTPDFCVNQAAGYYWMLQTAGGAWITTWAQLYARNFPESVGVACSTITNGGYPGTPNGYSAYALGAAATCFNSGYAPGKAAYLAFKPAAEMDAAFRQDPTWAIVPRT